MAVRVRAVRSVVAAIAVAGMVALAPSAAPAAPGARAADVLPQGSRPIAHVVVIDNVSDFRAWKFFLGPDDVAKSHRTNPYIPLEPADPGAAAVEIELSRQNPLDFGGAAPHLYVAKRELLVDGMPRAESRLVSAPLVEMERYVGVGDPTRRRVTTFHVKSIAPFELELVSDQRFDSLGGEAWSVRSVLLRDVALTIAVELAVAALILRRFDRRLVLTMVAVNLVTNPALALVVLKWQVAEPLAEALVVLVEWPADAKLLRIGWRRALLLAAATNLASWGVGALL